MVEGRKLQRHKGRWLNRRAHEAMMPHNLVVSFQKVSLGFTKPDSSCRDVQTFVSLALPQCDTNLFPRRFIYST
jgi:hypothetical protein